MHMTQGYLNSQLNIIGATQVKQGPGKLVTVAVSVAGAAGAIYDVVGTGNVAAGNQIGVIPAAVGVYTFWFPFFAGLVIAPGAAQVCAVSFE